MGAALGALSLASCGSQCAYCFGTAAVSMCCKSCPSCNNSTSTRVVYAVLLLVISIVAWTMLDPDISSKLRKTTPAAGNLECSSGSGSECDKEWGQLSVFRVMFSSTLFFAFMGLLMFGVRTSRDGRAGLQNGLWGLKLIVIAGTMIGSFWIPAHFFVGWGWVGLFGALFFAVVQLVLLVDFAHSWSESWTAKAEETRIYAVGLILATAGMYITAFIVTVLMFVYYTHADGESCGLNKFFISFNMILGTISTIMAIHPRVQEALPTSGILQSGVVIFYSTYLTWSAISNAPSECSDVTGSSTATTVIGAIMTFVAVAYSSVRTSSATHIGKLGLGEKDESAVMLRDAEEGDSESSSQRVVDNEQDGVVYNWSFFHFVFATACCYLMMILTDWAVVKDGHNADIHIGEGMASVWVKAVSSWLVSLLYIWSLIAPVVLADRVFSS